MALDLATRRLQKELAELHAAMPPLVTTVGPKDNLFEWEGTIQGPPDTVYAGGKFRLQIMFGRDYPLAPPKILFLTKVFHCNISTGGRICLDILKPEQWSPALTVGTLLTSIVSLLTDCNPNDPLQPTVGAIYKSDKPKHDAIAKKWVKMYAMW